MRGRTGMKQGGPARQIMLALLLLAPTAEAGSVHLSTNAGAVAPAAVDDVCQAGTFETEDHVTSYEVFFTNTSPRDCNSVAAYCLCQLSGSYRQSRTVQYQGLIRKGERSKIAEVETTGPAGRSLDWSWCKGK